MADPSNNSLLGMPALDSSSQAQYLTPEQAQALAHLAADKDESGQLSQQLQQADALRTSVAGGPQRHFPLAAAFDGIGNSATKIIAAARERSANDRQAELFAHRPQQYDTFFKGLPNIDPKLAAQIAALRGQQPLQQQPQQAQTQQGSPLDPAPDSNGQWQA